MKREDKQAILDEMVTYNEGTLPKVPMTDPLDVIGAILGNYEQMILSHVDDEEGLRRLLTPLLVVKHIVRMGYEPAEEPTE